MKISVKNGHIDKVMGNPDHPANSGALCVKGAAFKELVYAPDRLKYPLQKTRNGFKRITWDEALSHIAEKLLQIRQKHGPHTLIKCRGGAVTEATRDSFMQLLAVYGSNNHTSSSHLCSLPRELALKLVYGGRSEPDYSNTKCMLMWGANPTNSMRIAENFSCGRINRIISKAKGRGAKLLVVDPCRTQIAEDADVFLQIKPGTDAALALAILNVIITEDRYDHQFVKNWTVGFDKLVEHVQPATPGRAEEITGVDSEKIKELARTFADTKPALIRDGNGFDQYSNVVDSVRLTGLISAITGNVDVPGGNVLPSRPKLAACPDFKVEAKALGENLYPLFPNTFPAMLDAMLSGKPYKPRAMIVYHGNPALINANAAKVQRALRQLDFLVVSELFMTATAALADIVLPDTTTLERNGFQPGAGYDGGFVALRQKAIDPIGESRPVFEVEFELAQRMKMADSYPWQNTDEWIDYKLKPVGTSLKELAVNPISYVTEALTYRKYLQKGFDTPSGKVEIYSHKLENMGYNPLPVYKASGITPAEHYPLTGTTRRSGVYVHTQFRGLPSLRRIEPEPLVRIHPVDAEARGVADGRMAKVVSPQGSIRIKARISTEMQPGLVIIDFGWGNPNDGGINVNLLTSDNERDPFTGTTPNRRFICEVSSD